MRVLGSSCVFGLLLAGAGRSQEDARLGFPPRPGEPGAGSAERASVVLEGQVLDPAGWPAAEAVVTSSAGGVAVTDGAGRYRLEVEVPLDATSLELTAAGGAGGHQLARRSVALHTRARWTRLDPLQFGTGTACTPSWLPTYGEQPGVNSESFRSVRALESYDDGDGPALFAGGEFTFAGSKGASNIARWDGTRWAALGSGVNGTVLALSSHDDGSGRELFVGGFFSQAGGAPANRIAKWNGARWAPLTGGMDGSIQVLAVHDDGNGPALYAGGSFTTAGGVAASRIARWDGTSWSPLGAGLDGPVLALATYDDGSGPALYAGGGFTTAGGAPAGFLARWDGARWSALPGGVDNVVAALAVFDDGSGPALFAAGSLSSAGGIPARRIARWDGASWTPLAGGMTNSGFSQIVALEVFDDGAGPALYAAGGFTSADGLTVNRIARWDGASWSALESGLEADNNGVLPVMAHALAAHSEGGVPALFVGGNFNVAGGLGVNFVARWTGADWSALGRGLNDDVTALTVYDDGSGPALYAAGAFRTGSGAARRGIARWGGTSWQPLSSGVGGVDGARVRALAVYDDGGGPELYAGGFFSTAGGVQARRIAKWDGTSWAPLGRGTGGAGSVRALVVHDDGSGPALFVGGDFDTAGGVNANGIARWDGSWTRLGSGMSGPVNALAVYDDGGGPALYAAGVFSTIGSQARNIAKWDGSAWAPLGGGLSAGAASLGVHDDGSGPALYVGGFFTSAGGAPANHVARWDGTSWTALGSGTNDFVRALVSYDDGSGPALYAGGLFTTAGGIAANHVARWDGVVWSPLGSGMGRPVNALLPYDDGRGPSLYAGGEFWSATAAGDSFIARWGCRRASTFVLDFETEDDFATPLVNGQHLDTEFGTLVELTSSGPNAGLALFDSTPGGPNDPSQDRDLLVGSGKILILQTENYPPDANDVFPRPNDDEDGGTIALDFPHELEALALELVDLDSGDGTTRVELRDAAGRSRVYTVPANWTGDRLVAGPGRRVLDLTTLVPQPGFGSTATASEVAGFDAFAVVHLGVSLAGSFALDDVTLRGEDLPLPLAAAWVRNGSGVNPMGLHSLSLPVLGTAWRSTLDCTAQGPGLAVLEVRRTSASGARTPFGEPLIGGGLLYAVSRHHSGAALPLTWPIPLDLSLVGLEAHAQGLCLGSASVSSHVSHRSANLSNAVGLRLGF